MSTDNVIPFPNKAAGDGTSAIPENAVGVGGTVPPPEPVKLETVKVTVAGILNKVDSQPVENNMEVTRVQGDSDGQVIAYVWKSIRELGGLIFNDAANRVTFFPLEAFEKITVDVSPVVGVTL